MVYYEKKEKKALPVPMCSFQNFLAGFDFQKCWQENTLYWEYLFKKQ